MVALCIYFFVLSGVSSAQNGLVGVIGEPQDAVDYPIPGVGFVNLNNGNLHIDIPLRTLKDRDGVVETTSLVYDNSDFQYIQVPNSNGGTSTALAAFPGYFPSGSPNINEWASGLRIVTTPGYSGNVMWTATYFQGCNGDNQCSSGNIYSNWQYIDGEGTVHALDPHVETGDSTISQFGYPAGFQVGMTDGSGYWMVVTNQTNAVVYDIHGNIVYDGPGTEDTNGNLSSAYKDKLGRTISQLPGWTVNHKTIYVWTGTSYGFDIGNGTNGPLNGGNVIASITRPDGRSYTFQYDDAGAPPNSQVGHYGSLTGITLPTGGHIAIQSEWLGSSQNPYVVQSIQTPDGTWTFSYYSGVTVTAPTDPQTHLASQTTCACVSGGPQTISTYAGSATGTPLRQIAVQYSGPGHPSSITTSLDGTVVSTVDYTYPDTCTPRIGSKKEYDSAGRLLRETDVSFFTSSSDDNVLCAPEGSTTAFTDPYLLNGHHIVDIPQSATVYGAGGCCATPVAETKYTYDSTGLTATSGSAGNSVLGLHTSGGGALHDDANFGASMLTRGNLTQVQQMTTPGSFITTRTNYYNILGDLVQSVDGDGHVTNYDYTDNWNDASCLGYATFAYPTTVTNAENQATKSTYNSCDGTVASVQGPNDVANGRNGVVYTYDGLQRVASTSYPDGGSTGADYGGSEVPEVITTTVEATPNPAQVSSVTLDGLGRTITSIAANGATTQTTYDSRGRIFTVTNPYFTTSDSTYGVTTYTYDALNRLVSQLDSDQSSSQSWTYSGNLVTYTDEDGNQWQRTSDALGRLSQVLEPNGSSKTPNLGTGYQYDALNDLISVDQQGAAGNVARTRTFTYNGLSELITSTNPETGTVCYGTWSGSSCINGYDASGNLLARTDARGVTTNYGYDALSHLISKTYSGNVPAGSLSSCFEYGSGSSGTGNAIDRLVAEWTQSSSCPSSPPASPGYQTLLKVGGYDAMGRVVSEQQCVLGFCTSTAPPAAPSANCSSLSTAEGLGYCFDLAGNMTAYSNGLTSTAYPQQSMLFSQGFNAAAQLSTVNGSLNGAQLPPNLFTVSPTGGYTAAGALQNWYLGGKLNVNKTYDPRLRVTGETAKQQ